jgi:hypothetical protein
LWTITLRLFQWRGVPTHFPPVGTETREETLFEERLAGAHSSQSSSD